MAKASTSPEVEPAAQEPKNLGEVLDQMPLKQPPSIFEPPEPKLAVYRSIAMIIEEMGREGIAKAKEASQGGSFKYRGIDQVYAALNPLLHKHSLVILPRVMSRETVERKSSSGKPLFYTFMVIEFDFVSSIDGSRHTVTTVGEAMDSGDKSSNKCMAIAYKYAAFLTFCIPVDGELADDPDAEVHDVAPRDAKPKQETDEERRARMEAEARKNYNDAEGWLRACTTVEALKQTFENDIKWDRIPKGWHNRLVAVEKEMLTAINAKPAATTAPKFDAGGLDDDIPF